MEAPSAVRKACAVSCVPLGSASSLHCVARRPAVVVATLRSEAVPAPFAIGRFLVGLVGSGLGYELDNSTCQTIFRHMCQISIDTKVPSVVELSVRPGVEPGPQTRYEGEMDRIGVRNAMPGVVYMSPE